MNNTPNKPNTRFELAAIRLRDWADNVSICYRWFVQGKAITAADLQVRDVVRYVEPFDNGMWDGLALWRWVWNTEYDIVRSIEPVAGSDRYSITFVVAGSFEVYQLPGSYPFRLMARK